MSVNLKWFKVPTQRKRLGDCGTNLKYILCERYSDRDGSCTLEFQLTEKDICFIQGLAAAGVEDSKELLADLIKHGVLDVEVS